MRRVLSFSCKDARLVATLDDATGSTGLLIVSGGNEIRIGAHRGMARLAAAVAAAGHPVFRFDRRGVGDSEGENGGFEASAPDIAAAVEAFRAACPQLNRIVAFGNCDAASALTLHGVPGIDAMVLANPWVIERADDLPPPAAIRARYIERLRDPASWGRLLTGAIDLRRLAAGLGRIAAPHTPSTLSSRVGEGLARFSGPLTILAAERDATAIAFLAEWPKAAFSAVRQRHDVTLVPIDSASHSFAGDAGFGTLRSAILGQLADYRPRQTGLRLSAKARGPSCASWLK